jgi:hypothetical protein
MCSLAKGFKIVVVGLVHGSAERPLQFASAVHLQPWCDSDFQCSCYAASSFSAAMAGKRASEGGSVRGNGPATSGVTRRQVTPVTQLCGH